MRVLLLIATATWVVTGFTGPATAATITGTVTDKESGEPLPFANVLLRGTMADGTEIRRGVMGDEAGGYLLPNIPTGSYEFRIIYVGYEEYSDSLEITAFETLRLDVRLVPRPFVTEEVIVEGDRFAAEREVQSSFVNLDMKTLGSVPAVGEPDPIRTLQLLPGVQAASDISSGLYIRGGGPDQTLVLLDDIPIYNPTHAFGFFSTFNADAIDDVTLYKGAYPAEHGGRLGSVVEVRSLEAQAPTISGSAGISTIASRLAVQGPLGENRWLVAGRRTYLEPILGVLRRSNDEIPYYYFYDVNGKFTTKRGRGWGEANAYRGRDDIRFDLDEGTNININWGNTVLSASYHRLLGESVLGTVMLYTTEYLSDADASFLNTPFTIENRIRDLGLKAGLDWTPSSRHRVSVGAQASRFDVLYHQTFNTDQGLDFRSEPYEFSVHMDDQWKPFDGTSLRLGVRGRYLSDGDRFLVEPRLAASQGVGAVRIKLAGGLYNQYLQLVSTEGFSAADFYVPIDETADPSRSLQAILGAEWDATDRYQFSIEGYYTDLRDLVLLDNTAPADQESFEATDLFYTGGEGYASGVEFFAQRRTGNLTGWVGYTLGWTRRRFAELNDGERFPPKYDRRHDLNVVADYRRGKWSYGGSLIYATGQAFTPASARYQLRDPATGVPNAKVLASRRNSARLLPYHRLDVRVARDFSLFGLPAQWTVQVFNLYSRRNEWFIQYDENSGDADILKQLPVVPSLGVNFKF